MTKKNKKKMNVYVKGILILVVAGFVGGIIGFLVGWFELDMQNVFADITVGLRSASGVLMWIMAILSIVVALVCYKKCEDIIKAGESENDDEMQEGLDRRFDSWGTVGTTGTSVIIGLMLIIYPFSFPLNGENAFHIVVPLLLAAVVIMSYQSMAVRQIKRKDPMKRGDATDFNFRKEWLESCDEAERRVIYQASYKNMAFMRVFLMACMVVAMLGHLFWETGLTAVVLLGACYLASIIPYCIYVLKLQNEGLGE